MSSSFKPTVDIAAIFSQYSVEEYYNFWISLSALMGSYQFICTVKFLDKTETRDTTILVTSEKQITDMVNYFEEVAEVDKTKKILRDVIYNPDIKSQDFKRDQ